MAPRLRQRQASENEKLALDASTFHEKAKTKVYTGAVGAFGIPKRILRKMDNELKAEVYRQGCPEKGKDVKIIKYTISRGPRQGKKVEYPRCVKKK